jgi:hypothetical protein
MATRLTMRNSSQREPVLNPRCHVRDAMPHRRLLTVRTLRLSRDVGVPHELAQFLAPPPWLSCVPFRVALSVGCNRALVSRGPELWELPASRTDHSLLRIHWLHPVLALPLATEQQAPDHRVAADSRRRVVRHKVDSPVAVATCPPAPQGRSATRPNYAVRGMSMGLLRLGSERRKKEAESENDRAPDPPHGTPRWRMAVADQDRGSSRRVQGWRGDGIPSWDQVRVAEAVTWIQH